MISDEIREIARAAGHESLHQVLRLSNYELDDEHHDAAFDAVAVAVLNKCAERDSRICAEWNNERSYGQIPASNDAAETCALIVESFKADFPLQGKMPNQTLRDNLIAQTVIKSIADSIRAGRKLNQDDYPR